MFADVLLLITDHYDVILSTPTIQSEREMGAIIVTDSRCGFRWGARGPGPPLSDHTTIIKFSGPVLKYFLHKFSHCLVTILCCFL